MAGCNHCGIGNTVLCVLFFFLFVVSEAEYNEKLELLISKIERSVNFYEKNYKLLDLDGIFGLRILEGELLFLISQSEYAFDNSAKLPTGLVKRLKGIQERARITAENALPILQSSDASYYKKVGFLLESAWRPTVYYRKVSPSSRWPTGSPRKTLFEEKSDRCIQELHDATSRVENDFHSSCKFSNRCLDYMILSKHTYDYGLLHQILYIQIAQKLGCLSSLNSLLIRNGTNAYQLTAELCSNVHEQMSRTLDKTNNFRNLVDFNADLFCEQVFVCSNVGYMEFANISFMNQIVSWQQPSGCFRPPEHVPVRAAGKRHLLRSLPLKDDCSSHMTAVALGALSVYLRLFLDFNIQMYFPDFPFYPRLIIEERNEIQRRNLPGLIDERDALELERKRSKLEETDGFRPVWPGQRQQRQSARSSRNIPHEVVNENDLNASTLRDTGALSSYVKTFINWMILLSVVMFVYVLFRKGYFIRLVAFLYRRQRSVFHNV